MDLKTAPTGTILFSSYGYDQTNFAFYQIIERRGQSTLILRRLQIDSEPEGWCRNKVAPLKDQFTKHPSITRRISKYGYLKAEHNEFLHVWDGKPKHATSYA